ncbi:MAG: COP23 domain-containing protein [Cyanosarcina radialis HA8281-LM2]|jgi:hypothetical protein|nr:COP23 domain-containing protein [Cyanosarcina radialis HA8281-LM2]
MKLRLLIQVLTGLTLTVGTSAIFSQQANAQPSRFFCAKKHGVPITYVQIPGQGSVRMISWVTNGLGSPAERCRIVATRFQKHYENRTLKFVRTGTVNGYPVLCIADRKGGACRRNQVLVTLTRGTDPEPVLVQLLNLRDLGSRNEVYLSGSNPLSYVDSETYVDVDRLLEILAVEEGDSPDTASQ